MYELVAKFRLRSFSSEACDEPFDCVVSSFPSMQIAEAETSERLFERLSAVLCRAAVLSQGVGGNLL